MSSNNTPHSSAGSADEDDPWEMVGDEIAPLAASQDDDNATAVPAGDAKHGPSEPEAGAPHVASDDDHEQGDVGSSGTPSPNAGHPSIMDGGGVNNSGEKAASLPNSPKNPGKADAGERTKEDSEELEEPQVSPSPVAEAPEAPGAPLASAPPLFAPTAGGAHLRFRPLKETCSRSMIRSQTSREPAKPATETSDSRDAAASPPVASAPPAGSSEDGVGGEEPDGAALVDSLLGMGFDLERIEKALGDLRDAGAEVNEDSVIGAIVGELTEDGHAWEFLQTAVSDFERHHELRRRTRDCLRTVGRSLAVAREDSLRGGRAGLREAYDNARTAAVQVRYAASSAKDNLCRANEEYGIAEKVATAAAVGGALLLALGNPRAGVGAMAVAGTSMAAGEAMRQASARSTSTDTRDHGLREGLHLD